MLLGASGSIVTNKVGGGGWTLRGGKERKLTISREVSQEVSWEVSWRKRKPIARLWCAMAPAYEGRDCVYICIYIFKMFIHTMK